MISDPMVSSMMRAWLLKGGYPWWQMPATANVMSAGGAAGGAAADLLSRYAANKVGASYAPNMNPATAMGPAGAAQGWGNALAQLLARRGAGAWGAGQTPWVNPTQQQPVPPSMPEWRAAPPAEGPGFEDYLRSNAPADYQSINYQGASPEVSEIAQQVNNLQEEVAKMSGPRRRRRNVSPGFQTRRERNAWLEGR